eukprot:7628600-Pyramimonas_sp.AAC.1
MLWTVPRTSGRCAVEILLDNAHVCARDEPCGLNRLGRLNSPAPSPACACAEAWRRAEAWGLSLGLLHLIVAVLPVCHLVRPHVCWCSGGWPPPAETRTS